MATRQTVRVWACGVALVMLVGGRVGAQSVTAGEPAAGPIEIREERVEIQIDHGPSGAMGVAWTAAAQGPMDFDILTAPVDLGRDVVTGAPYAADAVTEVVQTLADGNRIVRSSTTAVYRDSTGRTRREQGLAVIGSLVGVPDDTKQVVIADPAAGLTHVLDSTRRTARRLRVPSFAATPYPGGPPQPPGPPAVAGDVVFFDMPVPPPSGPAPEPGAPPLFVAPMARGFAARSSVGVPKPEITPLGTRLIEGVNADGTRSTVTIPAGQIGNERPIEIVSERWFSPDLKALMLSKRTDPRLGETTYRLTNVVLGEPAASLFEVPADYQIIEGPGPGNIMFRRPTP